MQTQWTRDKKMERERNWYDAICFYSAELNLMNESRANYDNWFWYRANDVAKNGLYHLFWSGSMISFPIFLSYSLSISFSLSLRSEFWFLLLHFIWNSHNLINQLIIVISIQLNWIQLVVLLRSLYSGGWW